MNISLILEGWGNVVKDRFNVLDQKTKAASAHRLSICHSCSIRNGNVCDPNKTGVNVKTQKEAKGCGCNIAAKTLSLGSECPLGKWSSLR
jgi:hypothetical protein